MSCPTGYTLRGVAPACCESIKCHASCATCTGPTEYDCLSCYANAELRGGENASYCLCKSGFHYIDNYHACTQPHGASKFHEWIFDACQSDWESNGAYLKGASLANTYDYPSSAHSRGVFLNNKTYF
jgi:hypothetical protein